MMNLKPHLNSTRILIFLLVIIGTFLLFYRLPDLMAFFGDQGWYYLQARDAVLNKQVPLVGIPSSHPWLHQGAFWTYVLIPIFLITNFNPLAPGYVTAGLGVLTVIGIYLVGKNMFDRNVGLIAAFLYATSPLVIINARMPYHTSFIPITVLIFMYALFRWLKGKLLFFPIIIFLLAVLYNFEISTTPFTAVVLFCLGYGIWKKKSYVSNLWQKKIMVYTFIAWLLPMLPMLIYDVQHGFPQTIKFIAWIVYRVARLFGFPDIHEGTTFEPLQPIIPFTLTKLQQMLFLPHMGVALMLFFISILIVCYISYKQLTKHTLKASTITLLISFFIPFICYLALKTSSEAYWPMFFPSLIMVIALAFSYVLSIKKSRYFVVLLMLFIGGYNAYTLVSNDYLMQHQNYGYPFNQRLEASRKIIKLANGQNYSLSGKGEGSKFESFIMPYEYLTWWLGKEPTKQTVDTVITIHELPSGITVTKGQKK